MGNTVVLVEGLEFHRLSSVLWVRKILEVQILRGIVYTLLLKCYLEPKGTLNQPLQNQITLIS